MSRGSVAAGLAALRGWRTLILLFVAANLAALPMASAQVGRLLRFYGGTLAGEALRNDASPGEGLYLVDFLVHAEPWRDAAAPLAAGALLTLALQVFLAGGIVETVGRERRGFLAEFFAGCGRHLGHNLRQLLLFLPTTGVLLAIWLGATGAALGKDAAPAARAVQIVVAAAIFAAAAFAYDCARALPRVAGQPLGTLAAWRRGWGIFFEAPARALGVWFFWLAAGLVLWLGFAAFEWALPAGVALGASFVLQRLVVAARCLVRVGAWGSMVRYVERAEAGRSDREAAKAAMWAAAPVTEIHVEVEPEPEPEPALEPEAPEALEDDDEIAAPS